MSTLERKFMLLWTDMGGPDLAMEHKFHPERRWRFDFAHIKERVAIECEGGTWSGGRHTRGRGFEEDARKYFEAEMMGWTVFRLTSKMVKAPTLARIKAYLEHRLSIF